MVTHKIEVAERVASERENAHRDVFPVVYSTLSPQALITQVLSQYNLGNVNSCKLWNRGLSDVYLVDIDSQPYILRISHHHWRSLTDIQFELELLEFLYQRDLPVAYPIRTREKKLLVTIKALEGDRYAALFPYADGNVPLGDFNLTQSTIFGQTLAKLHYNSAEFHSLAPRQPLNLDYLLEDSYQIIAGCLQDRPKDLIYLEQVINHIKERISPLPCESPFWVVCWGDPHSGNVHFTENNRITLFDFDQCGYGWRIFDLAKFLQVSLHAGIDRKVRDACLAGYQSIQTLTEQELDSLPLLTQTAHIWVWAININAAKIHSWCRLDRSYFTKKIEKLKRLTSKDWQLF